MNSKPEQERITKVAWIFDVDGVITDPSEKVITEPKILDYIVQKLEANEPVALNTGRSLVWMIDRVINPLLEKVNNKKSLKNFFASGEKGGTWITFDENGKMEHHKDETISVPKSLQNAIRNLINSEFSDAMFYDETKETMISTEMKDGYSVEDYTKQQNALTIKLQKLVVQEKLTENLKIDPTTIATDIENIHVGKGFAIERILKWLKENNIQPQKFITFGDSPSDLSMSEKLHEKGEVSEFVFVGKTKIDKSYPFNIIQPKELFGKGAIEALESL
jgi:hydroxymethylpyrimidine pyrophosphatase-like HAD family hydrolase